MSVYTINVTVDPLTDRQREVLRSAYKEVKASAVPTAEDMRRTGDDDRSTVTISAEPEAVRLLLDSVSAIRKTGSDIGVRWIEPPRNGKA